MISFNQIPINIRTPGHFIEIDGSRAQQGLPVMPHKILVLGQRLSTGAVAAGVPTRITSAAAAEAAFGRGSMLCRMFAALKGANDWTESWGLALDDAGAGVAATGTVTLTGPATAAGTLRLYVGGVRVEVGVAAADTANAVATALAAAVNAKSELPVTASANAAVVTLTARNKGEAGNEIDLRLNYWFGDATPAGLSAALVAMASGTGNPDLASAITAMGDEQYHTLVMPYTDAANLALLEAELAARFGPMEMKEGHAFAAKHGSHGTIQTLGDGRNSPHLTIVGGQKSPTWSPEIAAVVAGLDAYETDPARPRQTLAMVGVLAPRPEDRYTRTERNLHLFDGIATYTVDAGGVCRIERLVTTYQENASGVDDTAFLDVETLRTLAYLRYSVRSRIGLKFPRYKLADDGTPIAPGQAVVTPSVIRAELVALFQEWMEAGLAENLAQFKRDLIVERNGSDPNRVDAVIPPDVINQFRVFAASVQFRL